MPRATSKAREPVGMTSTFRAVRSPRRIMEPLPYIFSIWLMALSMAFFLSAAGAAVGRGALSFAMLISSRTDI